MVMVAVGVGSNIDCDNNIVGGLDHLHQCFGDLQISCVYENPDYSKVGSDRTPHFYLNLVVCFESALSVGDLILTLKKIETSLGRHRGSDQVSLDLDLLLYDDWVGQWQDSVVPHHDIHQCDYVLRPLYDVIPQHKHPVFDKTIADLWQASTKREDLVCIDFVWHGQVISQAAIPPSL